MKHSRITSKGQTTVPKEVRQALGLKPGDLVHYIVLPSGDVRMIAKRPAKDLSGFLHDPKRPAVALDAIEAAIAAGPVVE
ncbi:AbrB/MazE/SpoVT family DNA-binding domain-containing protein [Jannaschia sp. CCS1]|uniref:AbrB/MazE/SpoVT family DNA-binding domain-containing protein n=1 Tax=Jannaschia sp. (strain CCS1) TaxID=290400 RepID=UPI000053B5EA|nr:type II toxin-antitoxin system PrlF family antitoxin [Jannaschia sp. CCS1]ABD55926.1 transcriptional regulator, AbrB family [Jannaschia sp. CCS1]